MLSPHFTDRDLSRNVLHTLLLFHVEEFCDLFSCPRSKNAVFEKMVKIPFLFSFHVLNRAKKFHNFIPILLSLSILPENRIITRMVIPVSDAKSPLARLVLFMVCLSAAGIFISGMYTFAVEQPKQQSLQAPTNAYHSEMMVDCVNACNEKFSGNAVAGRICEIVCASNYGG